MASIHVYKCTVAWKSPTTCNLCYLRIIGVCNIRQFIYAVFHVWILVIASAIIVLSLWIRRKKEKIDNFPSKYARNPELNFWMWHLCTFSVASILFWGHRYTWCTTVCHDMYGDWDILLHNWAHNHLKMQYHTFVKGRLHACFMESVDTLWSLISTSWYFFPCCMVWGKKHLNSTFLASMHATHTTHTHHSHTQTTYITHTTNHNAHITWSHCTYTGHVMTMQRDDASKLVAGLRYKTEERIDEVLRWAGEGVGGGGWEIWKFI